MIFACLAVTTMFASCDIINDSDDDDDGSGNENGNGRQLTAVEKELVGTWTNGGSTLQVRKILTGKYDIRRIGLGTVSSNFSAGVSYTFNNDGTYMQIVLGLSTLIIVEGKFSVSNNKISLTNNKSKSTMKDEVPIVWEKSTNPPNETHSFEIIYSTSIALDVLYLDGKNSEPAVGFKSSNDEI